MTGPSIARVILYVKDIQTIAAFYERFFSMTPLPGSTDGWLELASSSGGCTIALHQAAKSQKSGAAIKIVFAVADVEAFVETKKREGLQFGPIHRPVGFQFANAKDPAGNSISISSRGALRTALLFSAWIFADSGGFACSKQAVISCFEQS